MVTQDHSGEWSEVTALTTVVACLDRCFGDAAWNGSEELSFCIPLAAPARCCARKEILFPR